MYDYKLSYERKRIYILVLQYNIILYISKNDIMHTRPILI